ncbi:UNVERIFIED_CONTAM: Calcium/calmodulin-regulated receptor-like kinase [Sesamum radiatum]|uniref:Calcium/calmodulin-regulated receptor-like kinase n=1 Tax=Sesamum radiatum TaxID=300843 RepID=A0AAW2JDF5_SESRA
MREESSGLIVGISIGVVIGVALAVAAFFCIRYHRKRSQIGNSSSRRAATIPIRANGADSCSVLSDSSIGTESPKSTLQNGISFWLSGLRKANVIPASGILEYSYKDLQKATCNFTTLIGQGAYGPVYKAQMSTGELLPLKCLLVTLSKGRKSFKLRNLVNLVGYCAEKNQHMLIYVYMSRGSLASHLYSEKFEPLNWELRVQIALDVARGLEYLHDGAVPPVIHRDIKSSNILLDQSMRARAAMNTEGKVGWEEIGDPRLEGNFDVEELNQVAALAHKCVSPVPRRRPSMRDIVQIKLEKTGPEDKLWSSRLLSVTIDEGAGNSGRRPLSPLLKEKRKEGEDILCDRGDRLHRIMAGESLLERGYTVHATLRSPG